MHNAKYYEQVLIDMRLKLKRAQDELRNIKLMCTMISPFVVAAVGYTVLHLFWSAI